MTPSRHLTEAERHDVADGALGADIPADVATHLAECAACAADVDRVRQLMSRVREAPLPADPAGDLWPDIRARIEREKIVQLSSAAMQDAGRSLFRMPIIAAGIAAAVILVLVALPFVRTGKARIATSSAAPMAEVRLAADSARAFEREATILLNELELRRAMIPPQRRTSIDHDLQIIDEAILELQRAIERDPNNAALRRMLASSYRQKIDVLKRAGG
jgi:anti-sigma factor RsiW